MPDACIVVGWCSIWILIFILIDCIDFFLRTHWQNMAKIDKTRTQNSLGVSFLCGGGWQIWQIHIQLGASKGLDWMIIKAKVISYLTYFSYFNEFSHWFMLDWVKNRKKKLLTSYLNVTAHFSLFLGKYNNHLLHCNWNWHIMNWNKTMRLAPCVPIHTLTISVWCLPLFPLMVTCKTVKLRWKVDTWPNPTWKIHYHPS